MESTIYTVGGRDFGNGISYNKTITEYEKRRKRR